MFSDSTVDVVGFASCPDEERVVNSCGNQTDKIEVKSSQTNVAETSSIGVQASSAALGVGENNVEYDANKLAAFLKRILPHLEEELKDSVSTDDDLNIDANNYESGKTEKIIEVDERKILLLSEELEDNIISNLSWNSNGVLLGVAICRRTHEGWCSHEGSINVYNTNKEKFEKSVPSHIIKTFSCVQCIGFHLYKPSILAGGLYNGDIAIWDLANDEEVVLSREKEDGDSQSHTGAVTHLSWIENRNGVRLISLGRDGKIIFWRVTVSNLTYKVDERFIIFGPQTVPRQLNNCLEVYCIAFWKDKESDFVVAGGDQVFHCHLKTANLVSFLPGYKDPVFMTYTPHKGITTCVSCLPQSDIFASCGIDGDIHINKMEVEVPLVIINTSHPVMGIHWINLKCLISWGTSSAIENHAVDVNAKTLISTTAIEVEKNITAVDFNSIWRGKLAVGTRTGVSFLNNFDV